MKNLNFYGLDSSNKRQLRMAIDTSGNIGLGIADPTTRLEIVGDLSLNGSIYHNGVLFTPSITASPNIDSTTDISLNNLKVHGDLSANDASFNVIDAATIFIEGSNVATSLNSKQANISESIDVSLNNLKVHGDLSANDASFNVIDAATIFIEDSNVATSLNSKQPNITESMDISLNNLKVHGDLSANDASFNVVEAIQILINGEDLSSTIYTKINTDIEDAISDLVDNAPLALDTLNELAQALNDDANFYTTITNSLNSKQATITESVDVSLNNLKVHGDLSANDASFNVVEAANIFIEGSNITTSLNSKQATITESVDVSLNNLKVHGDLSANDASFNVIDVSAIFIEGSNVTTRLASIETDIAGKQDTLTAGTNITITGNEISTTNSSVWSGGSDIYYTDGNVSIGTSTNSNHRLRVYGNSSTSHPQIYASNSNYGILVQTNVSSGSGYCAKFVNSNSKGLTINANGQSQFNANVGIGIAASTSEVLHVYGDAKFLNDITIEDNLTVDDYVGIGTTASNTYRLNVNGTANFAGDVSMNDVSMNGGLTVSNLAHFEDNVGIGTTASSSYRLDVNGSANFTGDVSMNDVSMNGGVTVSNQAHFEDNVGIGTTASSSYRLDVNGTSNFTGDVNMEDNLTVNGIGIGIAGNDNYRLYVDGGQSHFDDNVSFNDNVSIGNGVSIDSSHRLYVSGNSNFSGNVTIDNNLTVDGSVNFTSDVSMNDVSMNGILTVSNAITTDVGYPYYQSLGTANTEYIVYPPSTTSTVHGVNITAMNKRTRASYASAEACVSTWTTRTAPTDIFWDDICWAPELSLFVAVASTGTGTNKVITSPDGITWTARTASTDTSWFAICWSPELSLLVAVALSGSVMTSNNGTSWTSQSASASSTWVSICWSPELSLFVAVAQSGTHRVMTSSNGTSWTTSTASTSVTNSSSWRNVCWSPELSIFVAVSESGDYRVMTSSNGTTWTAQTSSFTASAMSSKPWTDVCWSPELSLFVAVGRTTGYTVMTSPDGLNWTVRTAPNNSFYTVCWSPELSLFVSVSYNGTQQLMYSPDGINWTPGSLSTSSTWYSICWAPELSIFAAISRSDKITTSAIGMPNSKNVVKAMSSQMSVGANGNTSIESNQRGYTSPALYVGYGHLKVAGYWDGWTSTGPISIDATHDIYTPAIHQSSDKRIKNNIVDVPDNLALTCVRNIPCCYYNYIARPKQTNTIGFIAQEVKEVFPIAVNIITKCIPNIMQTVSGEWIERDDGKFDFYSNFFTDISFGTYKFHLKKDISDIDFIEKEVSMNDDRSFTFEIGYYDVFCYGIEVDDFHTLDKSKLFALNFSATQEIDRIQQQHIIDISNAQATIQSHEATIQQQQLEIENLKVINQDMNNQLNMIKEHLGL